MTRAQYSYYKEKLADEIVMHIKDIIDDATHLDDMRIYHLFFNTFTTMLHLIQ